MKPEMPQNKSLKDNWKNYICDVEITWVPESAPLGISETERLHDAMIRQSPLLCCRDARVCEVVPCEVSTGETCLE